MQSKSPVPENYPPTGPKAQLTDPGKTSDKQRYIGAYKTTGPSSFSSSDTAPDYALPDPASLSMTWNALQQAN
jgi:hypothetical protein